MYAPLETLALIARHPLSRARRWAGFSRYVRWQVGSRLLPGAVAVPFVDATRLLVLPGMTGATGNVYCGLYEFEEMAFVLHSLRPGDFFVDIGANVGAYTVLAAGAAGADCAAFEPVPETFARLFDNVCLNRLEPRVAVRNIGLGAERGVLRFTSTNDTTNHVLGPDEDGVTAIDVQVETLDEALGGRVPTVVKIDVEGFEPQVIEGARRTMQDPALLAVVMELNGSGLRYGYDDAIVHDQMISWGFDLVRYDPFARSLSTSGGGRSERENAIFVRNVDGIRARVSSAPRHRVLEEWL